MWLILSIIGYALLAIVAIMDKYLLSSAKVQPALYTFYSTIFVLPLLLLVPFGVNFLNTPFDWAMVLVSGVSFAFALWAMFLGFEKSEISHVGPLVGAAVPLFVLLFSSLFLSEILTIRQLVACGFLIAGSLIVSFEKSKQHSGWHWGMVWGILAGVLFAVSHVSAKYIYGHYDFYSGFVWTRAATGLLGLLLLFHPTVYRSLFKNSVLEEQENKVFSAKTKKDNIILVVINKVLGSVAVVIVQYAVAIGSVSLVNALNGLEYAFLIIFVLVLSKFWPKKFNEDYTGLEIVLESLAVVVIGVGLILLV
ncbi:MAG: EamA family transporter [Candidatus Magasanikbacteria bacterium]